MTQKQSSMLLMSMIVGVIWWTAMASTPTEKSFTRWIDKGPITVVGEVVRPVRRAPDRVVMIVDVKQITEGKSTASTSGLLRLTWREANHTVHQGNHVEVLTRLREPYGTRNPGGFDYGQYLKRKGIRAVASITGPDKVLIGGETRILTTSWIWQGIDAWRDQVHRAAIETLREPALGLFLGMIIGEQSFITPEVRDAFMATGTVHIISISGSHLGLIAFLVFFLVKGVVLRLPAAWVQWLSLRLTATRLAVITTIPVVSFYTLLAGGEIATVRSWIMIILFLAAVWMGREKHLLPALGIAGVFATVADPHVIYDTSFQLSYSAVLAIALVIRMNHYKTEHDLEIDISSTGIMGNLWKKATQAWWMTLAVTLVTLPLVAYYFNQIAWLGLLSNMVVVPLVGFLVIPLGLLSVIWVLITGSETLPFVDLNQAISDGLVQLVTWLAQIPGAEWHVASPNIMTMLVFYGLLQAIVVSRSSQKLQAGCVAGVCAILLWWVWSPRLDVDQNILRVTFLDVGQGDATVIELPDGKTILIDGGPAYRRLNMGQAVIGPYLWDRGISRIDHVIATHPQWDHVGGLPWVLKSFEVGQYWSNGIAREQAFYSRLQESILDVGVKKKNVENGQEIVRAGSCLLTVQNPLLQRNKLAKSPQAFRSGAELNNFSIITLLNCGQHSFLLTADAEYESLSKLNERPDLHKARVVKVPHHGAKSSLHNEWIEQLEAEVAVVSVGQHNRYGHPHAKVIESYAREEVPLYRTDRDGAVWIIANLDSPEMKIHTAEELALKPVQLDEAILQNEWRNLGRLWRQWTGTS